MTSVKTTKIMECYSIKYQCYYNLLVNQLLEVDLRFDKQRFRDVTLDVGICHISLNVSQLRIIICH